MLQSLLGFGLGPCGQPTCGAACTRTYLGWLLGIALALQAAASTLVRVSMSSPCPFTHAHCLLQQGPRCCYDEEGGAGHAENQLRIWLWWVGCGGLKVAAAWRAPRGEGEGGFERCGRSPCGQCLPHCASAPFESWLNAFAGEAGSPPKIPGGATLIFEVGGREARLRSCLHAWRRGGVGGGGGLRASCALRCAVQQVVHSAEGFENVGSCGTPARAPAPGPLP